MAMMVLGWELDLMIMEVFSNQTILWFYGLFTPWWGRAIEKAVTFTTLLMLKSYNQHLILNGATYALWL